MPKDIKSKGKDMRCNDIVRGAGGDEEGGRVSKCRRGCTLHRVHDIDLHPSAAPSVFVGRGFRRSACGFPRERQMYRRSLRYTAVDRYQVFVVGVISLRFVIAIASSRTRETSFTHDRAHSSLGFARASLGLAVGKRFHLI